MEEELEYFTETLEYNWKIYLLSQEEYQAEDICKRGIEDEEYELYFIEQK